MEILDLYINGFGKFHERSLSFGDGINIIYGKNEAGKSTIHSFIRSMLYGIEKQRGRASRSDRYLRFEPWADSGTYEGRLRVRHKERIYLIERTFQKDKKEFKIIDESTGGEIKPAQTFLDGLLSGLNEIAYNNTVSISQLKSATDEGMASELKNYIANLNATGNIALNITKASLYLKSQQKELEAHMVHEAARAYTSLLSEIRNTEKTIASPEYENQIQACQQLHGEVKDSLKMRQKEMDELRQKEARGKQVLAENQFSEQDSIVSYSVKAQNAYDEYTRAQSACGKKSAAFFCALPLIIATLLLAGAGAIYHLGIRSGLAAIYAIPPMELFTASIGAAIIFYFIGLFLCLRLRSRQKSMDLSAEIVQEAFSRHLGDQSISIEAMRAFQARMAEFTRLSAAVDSSQAAMEQKAAKIVDLQEREEKCKEIIDKQQKTQLELEKKLEHLSACKTQAEGLKHILVENDRIRGELAAIDLALETMTSLSSSIRDSFGLYLNKTASDLITGITGGIYTSLSVDESLNVFLNTQAKMVPLEQVSSGTMDQVYLALRLAATKLMIGEHGEMPLIFDDSFALYDDDRLKTALRWLVKAYKGQILIFTCHQREAQMLTADLHSYHLLEI